MADNASGVTAVAPTEQAAEQAAGAAQNAAPPAGDAALVEDELLVEEISIDGMCGVY